MKGSNYRIRLSLLALILTVLRSEHAFAKLLGSLYVDVKITKMDEDMKRIGLTVVLSLLFFQAFAENLPGQHKLKQNEKGEYYIVNKDGITMIDASIIKFGYNGRRILACIKNESVDTELKRWVFINVKTGGTVDSLNKENWRYFRDEAYPDLQQISLKNLSEESCP